MTFSPLEQIALGYMDYIYLFEKAGFIARIAIDYKTVQT